MKSSEVESMLQNYQYFLTLAETLNISRAAD